MRNNLKTTVGLQKERIDAFQGQLDKLGEEIAFDINKVYSMAQKSSLEVAQLVEHNAYTNNLIAQAGSFEPLQTLQNRIQLLEKVKIDRSEYAKFESKT